jgi:uncharacterized membrane protein YoaK (UPF0700 family)
MRLLVGFLLGSGLSLIGWSVWHVDTTLAQLVVIAAVGIALLLKRESSLSRPVLWQCGFYFIAGAGLGMLAYHGNVSLLVSVMWIIFGVWIAFTLVRQHRAPTESQ